MDTSNLIICTDASPDFVGIFDLSIAPAMLYYSYIPIVFISLLLGVFVLIQNRFSLISKILFLITLLFSIFIANELLQWVAVPAGIMYFAWALSLLLHFFIVLLTFYFVYLFINKNDFSFSQKVLFMLVSLPAILLLPTNLNVPAFDVDWCGAITGPLWYYLYAFEIATATFLLSWGIKLIRKYYRLKDRALLPSIYLLFGASFFLFVFFGSYFVSEIADLYEINLYEFNFIGPSGMLIFIGVLSFMIVKFKAFNIKLLGAQALVVALWFLVCSLLFVAQSTTTRVVAGVTLVFTSIAGYYLVRSVKKEVKQREELEVLTEQLAKANDRLKILDKMKSEFVSIASHQLRSPLTSIRGYASMLAEGSYGKLPEKAQEAANNIAESSKFMAMSIEDYLNVSRIEAGNMKYELSDFNLKDVAEKVVDEMRPTAMKKGLVMVFRSDCSGSCSIHADIGKTRQVMMNLVDNSMKYTPKGTITVVAHDDAKKKKMYVTIQDTGIGMSKETQEEVFDKFVRAKNANSVNVTGTGLGLFVAKKMVTEMNGKVWAESEGEGQGSTFHIEFPLLPGNARVK
jgi:signal transduction histidine kinase